MKKIYSIVLAALAVCAVSCQEGPLDKPEAEAPQTGETMTFTASMAQTKTTLDGLNSKWEDTDYIFVYDVNGNPIKSTPAVVSEDKLTASFTVTGNFGTNPYAVYAKCAENAEQVSTYFNLVDGVPTLINVPSEQTANLGQYDPNAALLKAQAGENNSLFFENQVTLIKFNVVEEGVTNVSFVPKTGTTITVSGTSMKGEYYIAIMPGDYEYFDIKQNGSDVRAYVNPKHFTPKANEIFNFNELRHTGVYLKGTFNGWGTKDEFVETGQSDRYAIRSLFLPSGTKLKVDNGQQTWFGCNTPIEKNTWWTMRQSEGDASIKEEGTYKIYYKPTTASHEVQVYLEK